MSENRYKLVPVLLKDDDGTIYEYMIPIRIKQLIIKLEEIIDDYNSLNSTIGMVDKIARSVRGY